MLPFLAPLMLIPGPYKLLAVAVALAASHGYAFYKGKQFCEGQAAQVEVQVVEKVVEKVVEVVKVDREAAEKFAKERDAARKEAREFRNKFEDLLSKEPNAKSCRTSDALVEEFNSRLEMGKLNAKLKQAEKEKK